MFTPLEFTLQRARAGSARRKTHAIFNGSVTYHDLTLTMLDGEAWLLRPPPR